MPDRARRGALPVETSTEDTAARGRSDDASEGEVVPLARRSEPTSTRTATTSAFEPVAPTTLRAEVEVTCAACGCAARRIVRTRREIQEELRLLSTFHRRRIAGPARRALQDRADFTHDYATRLVECLGCKLLYRSPRPSSEHVLDAYAQESYAPERLEQIRRSQLRSFRSKAKALARRLRPGARVLEVGSFVGSFLQAAREVGLDACGLDPSEQLARNCSVRGLRVERETLESHAQRSDQRYDAICVWNTFDQLPHPRPLLEAAKALLAPEGSLVLRVPNGAYYRAWSSRRRRHAESELGFAAAAWNNLVGFPYLSGHSLASLDRLMGVHGFHRSAVAGDTLCTLADRDYARWARFEELLWKSAQRLHAVVRPEAAPWLEARYARAGERDLVPPTRVLLEPAPAERIERLF